MPRISIISKLFLAILASFSAAINCQLDTSTFILSGKSFSIASRIISSQGNTQYRLNEHYSIEQRRGKVTFAPAQDSAIDLDFDIEYTYDAMIGAGIEHDKLIGTCKQFSFDGLFNRILRKGTSFGEIMDLAGANQDLSHVIGPARLLFLIASRADQMRPTGPTRYLRNIPTVMYELGLDLSGGGGGGSFPKLYILYNELTYYPNSPRTSIPLRIILNDAINQDIISIDFYQLEILSSANKVHSLYRSDARLAVRNSADETMDMFAFPISMNCDKHLGDIKHVDLLRQYDLATTRFSFSSDNVYLFELPSNHFVAFDGPTYSMRIDNLRKSSAYSEPKSTMTLLDFQTNRKYITHDDTNQRRKLRAALGTSGSQCVVTNILSLDEEDPPNIKLANLLLGSSKFAYMGRAQVNGLVARVYEASSITWPFWLGRPMLCRNDKGNSERRELYKPLRQTNPKAINTKEIYSIVVYILDSSFEEDTSNGAKLIQLEIYDLATASTNSYRMIVRARFHDFIWDLKEAPNGDKAHQLFSHIELCSAGRDTDNGGNKYAEVDLLLEEEEEEEEEEETGDARDIDWIDDWMLRDRALVSSFRDVLNVQSTMMYDLKSRFIKHDNRAVKRYVEVSFRVAEHPLWLHQVTFVGNAHVKNLQSAFIITGAQSPIDCLWLADSSIRSIYIYYAEASGSCIIDLKLVKAGAKMDLKKSELFQLNTRDSGEIYLVERRFDDKIKLANTWLRNEQKANVIDRLMHLQHIRADNLAHPVDHNELLVRIRAVKVKNVNFMQGISGENQQLVQPPADSFPGFNLIVSQESEAFVRRPGRIEKSKLSADSSMKTMFTREQCQTECLADVACQAYTYCVRGTDQDCLLTDLGFTGPGISEYLKSRDVQQLKQGSSVQVNIGQQGVQLVRDFRCELYNKIHMDFFKRQWPSTTSLRGPKVFQVNNEEQCAKLCFGQSLSSILSSVALANEIENSLSSIENAKSISNDKLEDLRRKHSQEMAQFCRYFVYLGTSLSEQQERVLKRRVKATSGPMKDQGGVSYCVMDDILSDDSTDDDNEFGTTYFQFAIFRFDFAKLFEKKYDFGLKGSEFSQEEDDAYLALYRGESMESNRYELLKKTVADGKNRQLELHVDENICAQQCFMQSSGLWPACRSFDMRQVSKNSGTAKTTDFTCVLNTESYNSEKAINEVKETNKSDTKLWHYEPRFRLAQEEVDNAYLLDELIDHGRAAKGGRPVNLISSLGVFLVVLVGVVSGLASGLLLTRKFIESSKQKNEISAISTPYHMYEERDDI